MYIIFEVRPNAFKFTCQMNIEWLFYFLLAQGSAVFLSKTAKLNPREIQ